MALLATYWTLQDLGDPLLLLHHVEVLPQVRRHGPAAEGVGVAVVHPVQVALPGAAGGQGQGERPHCRPHLHRAHVAATPKLCRSGGVGERKTTCFTLRLSRQRVVVLSRSRCRFVFIVVTHVITATETKKVRRTLSCDGCCVSGRTGVVRMQSRHESITAAVDKL